MKKIRDILNYKKQVVIQGPPGTGKTRLAELIAAEMTQGEQRVIISDLVDGFFKNFNATQEVLYEREHLNALLAEFYMKFPKDSIEGMRLEDYAFGDGSNDSFSWWIEYGLFELGAYTGQAGKFKIYWKAATQSYLKSGVFAAISNDNEAMRMLAEQISNVAHERCLDEALGKLSKGYVLKLLHTYNPDKYFPVNSEKCLDNIIRLLNISADRFTLVQKNMAVQQYFLNKLEETNADVTNIEFMRFLFDRFPGIKGAIEIAKDEVITKGEYQIVQFHPAYSYEDFVRGIRANTNENGQVEYVVENKALVEFALKALDNPGANYVLIVDEINRANLPAVLGELIYSLEYRGKPVEGVYALDGERTIVLPSNLYIIGTMNTADRSVGHIDYAIRRRFAFVDLLPSKDPVSEIALSYFRMVSGLFISNYDTVNWSDPVLQAADTLAPDFRAKDVWLGHSYFIVPEEIGGRSLSEEERKGMLHRKMAYEVAPLLEEYVKDGVLTDTDEVKGVIRELSKDK